LIALALLPLRTMAIARARVVPVPDAWGTTGALVVVMVMMVADIGPGCY
jgi:hypothetical protein